MTRRRFAFALLLLGALLGTGLVLLGVPAKHSRPARVDSVAEGIRIADVASHVQSQLRTVFWGAIGQLWELICYLCPTETLRPQQLGALEDCTCDASVVDAENTVHFNPILSELVKTAYFRYFKVSRLRKPCMCAADPRPTLRQRR
jgi:hypothetical protein